MSYAQPRAPRSDVGIPDVGDAQFYATGEHLSFWQKARVEHPVFWTDSPIAGGFWSVVSHALANQVLKQPSVFTSTQGMRLGGNPASVRMASGKMLTVSDGIRHQRIRAVHIPWFTSRAVAELRANMQRRLDEHIRELTQRTQPFDVVETLTSKFPVWAVFEMMDIPVQDWDHLAELTDVAYNDANDGPARLAAQTQVLWYFSRLLDERRAHPGDDIISALVQTTVEGSTLSDDEILLNCDGLVIGGLETTQHTASGAILTFAEHPEAWARLRANPDLVDSAVEELLRWTSPAMHVLRTALTEVQLGDRQIKKSDRVVVWLPSCNRDERVFADANTFVIDRQPNPHVSFSVGPHYCVGAPLARLELRCYLRALARFVSGFELLGTGSRVQSTFLNGMARLDLTFLP